VRPHLAAFRVPSPPADAGKWMFNPVIYTIKIIQGPHGPEYVLSGNDYSTLTLPEGHALLATLVPSPEGWN
jgi:hypothetical protein